MKKGIIGILSAAAGAAAGAVSIGNYTSKELNRQRKMAEKHLALFVMMDHWVEVKQEGKNLAEYFKREGYKTVAIYGMHYAGERLYAELKNTEIEVKYGIDKNADTLYSELDIYHPDADLEHVDVVVITPVYFFSDISKELSEKFTCPIISLEDILYEV